MSNLSSPYICFYSIIACISLTIMYVASLYIWNSPYNRDHPSTIKKRFCSALSMMVVSPLCARWCLSPEALRRAALPEQLGLRAPGLAQAALLPLLLTALLFLGPIVANVMSGLWKLYTEVEYWRRGLGDLVWLRNHVVAPLSEEFVFRACMMPLLLQCLPPLTAVFVSPLLFGLAHFHHMIERLKSGCDWQTTIIMSCFQFSYTSLFGAYSAFLFARTGHFVAPLVAHVFCNHMGFPDVGAAWQQGGVRGALLGAAFLAGLLLWAALLQPLTQPALYHNSLHWDA